jgi:trehalose 6-phosphate phosphatase
MNSPPLFCADRAIALFLDLDGTLAPFAAQPDLVAPSARRTAIVKACADQLDGRLAVISGRPLQDIDRILQGAVMTAAGVHGLERRNIYGAIHRLEPSPAVRHAVGVFNAAADIYPGLWVEDKGLSVALHYRNAPAAEGAALNAALALAAETGLVLQRGDKVVELLTPGPDKGDALRAFMAAPPFLGTKPLFVGDDLTDEAGFVAAAEFGGYGVLVGARGGPTAARYRLGEVDEALDWLAAMADAHGKARALSEASASWQGGAAWRA